MQTTAPKTGSLMVIFLTVFIDLLGFGMVLPLLPIYAKNFETEQSGLVLGLLMASFSAMQFLWAPVWGRLSDRIGRRPVLMIGLAGSIVFYAIFGLATVWKSLAWMFVSRIGAGIAGANIPITQAYIADTTTLESRTKGMSLIGAAFGAGFAFGPLLGSLAIPSDGGTPGPGPGYAAAALSAFALTLAWFKLPESLQPGSASAARKLFNTGALRDALFTPSIGPLLVTFFILVLAFANYETTLALLLNGKQTKAEATAVDPSQPPPAKAATTAESGEPQVESPFHFSFQQVLYTFAYIGVTLAFAQGFLVRRLSGVIREGVMATMGAVLEIAGFCMMLVAIREAKTWELFVALSTIVVGFALMMPSLSSLLSRRSDPAKQGGILGLSQSMAALARILGPMMGIPLLMYDIRLPYLVAAGMMGVGLVMIIISTRGGHDYGAVPAVEAGPMEF